MSCIVTSVLNLTFGLLWNKVRDHTANKLKEGDMTDDKCRQLIVRELDDITTKIDGLARKDLLSSVSFVKEGLTFLNLSQDESTDGETSCPQEQKEDLDQAEASTMMAVAAPSSVFNQACSLALSKELRKLNIVSGKRFSSAMRSFQESKKEATRAFNNEALNTEDRIMATKLRVVSRILESLQDPDAAAATCKVYLEELHRMPAVREMFSVQLEGGMKSRFYRTKRFENVMSVTVINCVVFNFTKKFTKMGANLSHWPSIELGQRSCNPVVVLSRGMLTELEESGVQQPNKLTLIDKDSYIDDFTVLAVNSKGEIIIAGMRGSGTDIMKITTAVEIQLFCRFPPEETETNGFDISSLAIDGEDNVYIVTRCDNVHHYKLFVYDAIGNMKHQSPLNCFDKTFHHFERCTIAITKDKKIIACGYRGKQIHVCDISGELKYSFPTKELEVELLSISDENEIIAAARSRSKFIHIYTEEGNEKTKLKVPKDHGVWAVAFNHVTKEVIVLTYCEYLEYTSSYSTTGLKLETVPVPFELWHALTSHPSGPVALVNEEAILYIQ